MSFYPMRIQWINKVKWYFSSFSVFFNQINNNALVAFLIPSLNKIAFAQWNIASYGKFPPEVYYLINIETNDQTSMRKGVPKTFEMILVTFKRQSLWVICIQKKRLKPCRSKQKRRTSTCPHIFIEVFPKAEEHMASHNWSAHVGNKPSPRLGDSNCFNPPSYSIQLHYHDNRIWCYMEPNLSSE